ncbi:DMT family transporter [Allorhizocola rhizosphaerae]|uniref:DMT family transporter n=1 Tax=Allorhizocola rhizosphaerae TaxID=1872709 RepID=UPI000E3EA6DE|nr:SMR family transporter [Allorhizocola rhizosphaerae]
MAWVFLVAAIVAEVMATISLRLSEGFSKLVPTVLVVVGYAAAFTMLSFALKRGMPVAVGYAVWAAAGIALISIIGATFLDEKLSVVQIGGIALVIAGVVALEVGGAN